jgi:hypothetical protein
LRRRAGPAGVLYPAAFSPIGASAKEVLRKMLRRMLAGVCLSIFVVGAGLRADTAAALEPVLRIEPDQPGVRFGSDVASAGDVDGDGYEDLIVGSMFYTDGQASEGAAFVFHGGPGGLAGATFADADTVLQSNQAQARMGVAVGSAGDVNGDGYGDVIVGAGGWESPGQAADFEEGGAFVFLGGPGGIPSGGLEVASAILEGDAQNARLGSSVSSAGDVDGDGYDDVIAGGYLFQSIGDESREGVAMIFLGGPDGVASAGFATAHAVLQGNQSDAFLGNAVAGPGDLDGDGYDDVIVGAPRYNAPDEREGAVFVFYGSPDGIEDGGPATAGAQLEGDQIDARFGYAVAGAGDVNADGFADFVVGAPRYDADQVDEGVAFVFLGGAAGIESGGPDTAATQLEGDQPGSVSNQCEGLFGCSVAGGDWDGDGYADVVVGSPFHDSGQTDEGLAFLFRGGPDGIADAGSGAADERFEANFAGIWLGWSTALADMDDDGAADAFAGAWAFGDPPSNIFTGDPGHGGEGAVFSFSFVPEPGAAAGALVAIAALLCQSRRR